MTAIVSAPLLRVIHSKITKMRHAGYDKAYIPIVDAVEGTYDMLVGAALPSVLMSLEALSARVEALQGECEALRARVRELEDEDA